MMHAESMTINSVLRCAVMYCLTAVASRHTRGPIDNNIFYLTCGPCLACHKIIIGSSVPNSVNDMACCIISFTPLTDMG